MARGTVLIIALVCTMYGIFADDCPSVDDMVCMWKQPVDDDCKQATYIELEDGTECPACDECLDKETIAAEAALGLSCPIKACSTIDSFPENCTAKSYTSYSDFDGNKCERCDTIVCE